MNTAKIISSIQQVVRIYKARLATTDDLKFQQCREDGSWSYSEVYQHIFDLSILSLAELDKCLSGDGKSRKTHWIARGILYFGRFPPAMKFKVPKTLAARVRKVSAAEASEMIDTFLKQLEPYGTKIAQADPSVKTRHPRLGYFNAAQWLRFIEIHLKHHLKQLDRIDKSF
jgi:hypothetical protein